MLHSGFARSSELRDRRCAASGRRLHGSMSLVNKLPSSPSPTTAGLGRQQKALLGVSWSARFRGRNCRAEVRTPDRVGVEMECSRAGLGSTSLSEREGDGIQHPGADRVGGVGIN